ncbi:MAG: hypothetical protein WD270_03110 [Acetobacterales bacterium]
MLDIDSCIALCGLTREEVEAIAEHEHVPEIVAAELGNYLVCSKDGVKQIREMIVEDIQRASAAGRHAHAGLLKLTLKHFVEHHPELLRKGRNS